MEEENTLELIDYFRVIWKWRWFITLTSAVFLLLAVMVNIFMADVYDVSMVMEPAISDFDSSWRPTYIDSSSDIESKIDLGIYDSKIRDAVHFDSAKDRLFKTFIPKKSNLLKVGIETPDLEKGGQALRLLYNLLIEEYRRSIEDKKLQTKNVIGMKKAQYKNIIEEENQLKEEIKKVGLNTEELIKERDLVIRGGENNANELSVLIYINTIQSNIAYKNKLQRQLNTIMSERETKKTEIDNLEVKLGSIRNIRLLNPPEPSVFPIKPRKLLNITLAFFLGLITSLFLAFFIEYIQKARTRF